MQGTLYCCRCQLIYLICELFISFLIFVLAYEVTKILFNSLFTSLLFQISLNCHLACLGLQNAKTEYRTIASMPSLLCRSQISIGSEFGQYIPTVVHTVRELQLWSKEIEWRHPSTKGSYCGSGHFEMPNRSIPQMVHIFLDLATHEMINGRFFDHF